MIIEANLSHPLPGRIKAAPKRLNSESKHSAHFVEISLGSTISILKNKKHLQKNSSSNQAQRMEILLWIYHLFH